MLVLFFTIPLLLHQSEKPLSLTWAHLKPNFLHSCNHPILLDKLYILTPKPNVSSQSDLALLRHPYLSQIHRKTVFRASKPVYSKIQVSKQVCILYDSFVNRIHVLYDNANTQYWPHQYNDIFIFGGWQMGNVCLRVGAQGKKES